MPARSQPIPSDRLRKYLGHGMTARAIAERTGRSDVAVYAAIKAAGLTLNRCNKSKGAM
jgi:transposase